jgi:hypothetical protein
LFELVVGDGFGEFELDEPFDCVCVLLGPFGGAHTVTRQHTSVRMFVRRTVRTLFAACSAHPFALGGTSRVAFAVVLIPVMDPHGTLLKLIPQTSGHELCPLPGSGADEALLGDGENAGSGEAAAVSDRADMHPERPIAQPGNFRVTPHTIV